MATAAAPADDNDTKWIFKALKDRPPPIPLPNGWVLRSSRSQPGVYYYYHQETGISQWTKPIDYSNKSFSPTKSNTSTTSTSKASTTSAQQRNKRPAPATTTVGTKLGGSILKTTASPAAAPAEKRQRTTSSSSAPSQVRVLHILKKHNKSRRPASWRNPKITATKREATEELQQLLEVLQESQQDSPEELRATFEELARTESDCSSAKRGGDLGFFGRKKMQPAFESASFGLNIGELSDIVETSSGVHIILRVG